MLGSFPGGTKRWNLRAGSIAKLSGERLEKSISDGDKLITDAHLVNGERASTKRFWEISHRSKGPTRKMQAPPGYIGTLPREIGCMVLRGIPLNEILVYYAHEEWRPLIESCAPAFANRQEIVYIALNDLLRWDWTRRIKYVVTDFPENSERWPALLEALKEHEILGILMPDIHRAPLGLLGELRSGAKRIAIGTPTPSGYFPLYAIERYGNLRSSVTTMVSGKRPAIVVVPDEGKIFLTQADIVLSPLAYEMFAGADLGLANPVKPPGPDNKPLRDILTLFWTFVASETALRMLFHSLAYMGDVAMVNGEEGNWVWLAPYLERLIPDPEGRGWRYNNVKKISAYLRRFNVYSLKLAHFIATRDPGYRRGVSSGVLSAVPIRETVDAMGVDRLATVADVVGVQLPRPMPGEDFRDSINRDEANIGNAQFDPGRYDMYLVNGRKMWADWF